MRVFIDTSAVYAIYNREDYKHLIANDLWNRLLDESVTLATNSYVVLETIALLQRRLGVAAVRSFHENVMPLLQVEWVDEDLHRSAAEALLVAHRKKLSLVDCVSFQ